MKILEGFFKDVNRMKKLAKTWADKIKDVEGVKSLEELYKFFLKLYDDVKKNAKDASDPLEKKFFESMLASLEKSPELKAAKELNKRIGENKMAKKNKLDEGMVMIASLLPVGGVVGLLPKRVDNFVFKGLPGQFDKDGVKTLDEYGDPIKEAGAKFTTPDEDAKYYKKLLDGVKKDLEELQDVGEDFGIWQNAKSTASTLKKMYKLVQGLR